MKFERAKLEKIKAEVESPLFEGENWVLPTYTKSFDRADKSFVKRLEDAGWSADEIFGLRVGFKEALNNAFIHGNKMNLDKKVYVNVKVNKNRIFVKIRDEGDGFKPGEVPNPLAPENLLKPKGRGLHLLKQFFDSVTYNEKGNEVTLIKERKK